MIQTVKDPSGAPPYLARHTHPYHISEKTDVNHSSPASLILVDFLISTFRRSQRGDIISPPLPNKWGLIKRPQPCMQLLQRVQANPWPLCTTAAGCSFSVFRRKCFPFLGQWMPALSPQPPSCVRKPPSPHSPSLHKLNLSPPSPSHTGKETYRVCCFDSGSVIWRSR